jgi:class 3 adenylate cyclase
VSGGTRIHTLALDVEGTLISNAMSQFAELCAGKGLAFQDMGEVSLRGFERPVRVHSVDWP